LKPDGERSCRAAEERKYEKGKEMFDHLKDASLEFRILCGQETSKFYGYRDADERIQPPEARGLLRPRKAEHTGIELSDSNFHKAIRVTD
jgi:hypothetical protein